MLFSRVTVTKYNFDRVDLSFTSIVKFILLFCAISFVVFTFTFCRFILIKRSSANFSVQVTF